jgi:predicted small metal-binding protein
MKVLSAAALAANSPRALPPGQARSEPSLCGGVSALPTFAGGSPMMTKELKCGTVVPGCEYTVHAETDAELLAKIADHARAAHDIEHISEPLRAKILAAARGS